MKLGKSFYGIPKQEFDIIEGFKISFLLGFLHRLEHLLIRQKLIALDVDVKNLDPVVFLHIYFKDYTIWPESVGGLYQIDFGIEIALFGIIIY